jgi:UDP-glucose 4-epimerase
VWKCGVVSGNRFTMTRYLITGGAGFIGSHVADSLLDAGHSVRVMDDLSTGGLANLRKGIELVEADIVDQAALRHAFDGIDGCFHLAAIASVERSHHEWLRSHEVNLAGTIAIFEEARRRGEQYGRPLPVVYASSAAIYGDARDIPIGEAVCPHPMSAYGADKLGCEMHARVASLVHHVPTVGLRFFNVYGPRQDPRSPYSGVVSVFCNRLREGLSVDLHGSGNQVRDFVYVSDATRALICAMDSANQIPKVFNVCSGQGTTIRSLGETIASLCGTVFHPINKPRRDGDLDVSIGDPRKIEESLGFRATVSLRDGLAKTLAAQGDEPRH